MVKSTKPQVRKLTRTGRVSYTVNVPKPYVKKMGWKERQKLAVKLLGKKVVVESLKK